jgi:UDP:flavonoid glycosyltransferase YjiC (YdhE family)
VVGRSLPGSLFRIPSQADVWVQFTVPAFEYPRSDLAGDVRFVGPMGRVTPRTVHGDAVGVPEWWGDLEGRRLVHVTQGTIANADLTELIVPTIRGLAEEDVLVVVSTGGRPIEAVEEAYGGPLPANVRVAEYLPYDLLLPRVDAMVTNGGYGGVHAALSCGVPLVVSGRTEDKTEVTARVAWSGAGVNLRTQRPKPSAVAKAVRRVLADPSFRGRSEALARDIAASGGAADLAALVRELTADAVQPITTR